MIVVRTSGDLITSVRNGFGFVSGECANDSVGASGTCLDQPQRVDQCGSQRSTGGWCVVERALRLRPPQCVARHRDFAHRVAFDPASAVWRRMLVGHEVIFSPPTEWRRRLRAVAQ